MDIWNKKKYWFKVNSVLWGAVFGALPLRPAFFSSGDENTRGPSILKRDVGVRALGLGGAVVGMTDDPSSLHWNPAGIQSAPRQEVQLMHAAIFADQTHDFLGYVLPYWRRGERETVGVLVSHLDQGQFDVVDDGQSAGTAHPSETVMGVSFARPAKGGAWGLLGKWVRQDLYDQQGDAYALDAGFRGVLGAWGYGISMANLGSAMKVGETHTELPLVIRTGVARTQCPLGSGMATAAAQIDIPADDPPRGRLGGEWACPFAGSWRGAVRSGYRTDGNRFVFGAGLSRGGVEFNCAYALNGEVGASTLFDLTVRFGSRVPNEVRREKLMAEAWTALDQGQYSRVSQLLNELHALSPRARDLTDLRARLNQSLAETIDPALLWKQGQEAQNEKKWETAALFYRKLLIVQPGDPDGAKALEDVEKELKRARAAAAEDAVQKARVREMEKIAQQARSAADSGEWLTAVKLWKRVGQAEGPGGRFQQEIIDGMARAYAAARQAEDEGRFDRAVALYQALSEFPSPYQDSDQRRAHLKEMLNAERARRGQSIYEEGLRAYRQGNMEKARSLFEQAHELAPQDKAIQRAWERMNLGKPEE